SKSDVNQRATEQNLIIATAKNEALMNQINFLLIPQIQKELTENNYSLKELAKDVSSDRERLARVEGIIEGLPSRLTRDTLRQLPKPSKARSNLSKALSKHVEVIIPTLEQFEQTNILKGD
ncbi:MAG: hypothetical protein DRI65_17440, partial [Chloroflexota bacterium]